MTPPNSSFTVPPDSSAQKLLQLGKPFIEFPRFNIQSVLRERDYEGNPIPFSEWLTKRLQVGQPFVIGDFDQLNEWPKVPAGTDTPTGAVPSFGIERLIELSTKKNIPIHNCSTGRDLSFTLRKFADSARQSFAEFKSLYARDLQCPQEWLETCREILPTEVQWGGRLDLFQWLPQCARSEVMMAYVGSEGSSSGFHRCFSSTVALNLLVDGEDDRPVVCIGTDFESQDKYDAFMSAKGVSPHLDWFNVGSEELLQADFPLYVYDQRVGDLVVLPPATAHQIWNPSTLSTKLVWNILHPLSLEVGIEHVQPPFNRLCHPDVARTNLSLACAMLSLIQDNQNAASSLPLPPDLPLLSRLFRQMVHDESIESTLATPIQLITLGTGVIATCNFCNTAIWNRHVRCKVCTDFDLCLLCCLNGRSCEHPRSYSWAELVIPEQCNRVLNRAREVLGFQLEPRSPDRCKTLGTAVNDLMKSKTSTTSRLCHLCRIDHPDWKGRPCDKCTAFFCYRGLYRHFDMSPVDVMRHSGMWTCPKCSEICNCRCCHFATAYEKHEKPASKRRVKAFDNRGKVMGFADNVFDQKRGSSRGSGMAVLSAAQMAGKKRPLEPTLSTSASHPASLLPTPEPDRRAREHSEFTAQSPYAGGGLPTLLPSVKQLTDAKVYKISPPEDRNIRGPLTTATNFGSSPLLQNNISLPGPMNTLPPMLSRSGYSNTTQGDSATNTTASSGQSRAGSSFINTVTTTVPSEASPAIGYMPERSPTKPSASLISASTAVIDTSISEIESKIQTLRRYDDEFVTLGLEDSRKVLHAQIETLQRDLEIKKRERGMSLMERLQREGLGFLAEAVGNEVGIH